MPISPNEAPNHDELRKKVRQDMIVFFQTSIDNWLKQIGHALPVRIVLSHDWRFNYESFDDEFWQELRTSYKTFGWKDLTYETKHEGTLYDWYVTVVR